MLDKGFTIEQGQMGDGLDLCTRVKDIGIFIKYALLCDNNALFSANRLITWRKKAGVNYDYALVVPALQESLGVTMLFQEAWVSKYMDYLTTQRIYLCAVDNRDPNQVYAFTIYPRSRDLVSYFVVTSQQWSMVREGICSILKEKGAFE
jgi:hypothetical protein